MKRAHLALAAVLLAGLALRLVLMVAYTPAYLSYPDTWGYVKAAAGPLIMDDWIRPAGYPAFLAALHGLWGSLTLVLAVQHALGIATALLAYATVRRLGAPGWAAVVPAAVVLLCLDFAYFEHTLLSESLFTALSAASLYALVRSLDATPRAAAGWAALAGLAAAYAVLVRPSGVFVLPVLGVAALAAAGPLRLRLLRAGALTAVVLAVLVGYAALNRAQTGTFGLSEGSGWTAYSRAAPFADCRVFTPPPGTEGLCETTDVRERGGPDFYAWGEGSPGRRLFVGPPYNSELVGAWGRAAMRAQPRAYASAVISDLWRYVDPDAGRLRPGNGAGPEGLALDRRDPNAEQLNRTQVEPLYGPYRIELDAPVGALADAQEVLRVHGVLVLLALVLSVVALPFAGGRRRLAILLLGATAVVPVVLATATTVYNWRYAVPALPGLLAAGAVAADVLLRRARSRPASRVGA
jgi:4-amino-4-deoxy-L-arabinose transferase-like glycosyltransferase